MASTWWPRADLVTAEADSARQKWDEMLARFDAQQSPENQSKLPQTPPKSSETPPAFDLDALMPWKQRAEGAVQNAATAVTNAAQTASSLFDVDALMPWKPKPAPQAPEVTGNIPGTSTVTRPAAPSGTPRAMPTGAATGGAQPTGGDWESRAYRAAQAAGHPDPDEFVEQMRLESMEFRDDVISGQTPSSSGALGIAQIMPDVAREAGVNPLDPDAALTYAARRMAQAYRTYEGDPERALASYHMGAGNVERYGPRGLEDTAAYIDVIRGRAGQRRQGATPQAQQQRPAAPPVQASPGRAAESSGGYSAGSWTPNQIDAATAEGLDYETALAVCGPAAAIAFARRTGRNPTMQEALALAKQVGWTVEQGMAGPDSQRRLLQSMGIAARLTHGAPDWQVVAADVQRGNPVIISTPGHYFVAERYNPEDGTFDFGASTAVLKAAKGRRWFRPEELASLGMGEARASLFMDSPESPSPSAVAGRSDPNAAGAAPPSPQPAPDVPPSTSGAGPLASIGVQEQPPVQLQQAVPFPSSPPQPTNNAPYQDEQYVPRPEDHTVASPIFPRRFEPERNIEPLGPALKGATFDSAPYPRPGARNRAVPGDVEEWTEPAEAGEGLYPSGWPRNSAVPSEEPPYEETPAETAARDRQRRQDADYTGAPVNPGRGYEGMPLPIRPGDEFPWTQNIPQVPQTNQSGGNQSLSYRESLVPVLNRQGQVMAYMAPDDYDPRDADSGPRESGYTLPPDPSDPRTADEGPREALPGSVGATPVYPLQSPNNPPNVSPIPPNPRTSPVAPLPPPSDDPGGARFRAEDSQAPVPRYDNRVADEGPREALPGTIGARPIAPRLTPEEEEQQAEAFRRSDPFLVGAPAAAEATPQGAQRAARAIVKALQEGPGPLAQALGILFPTLRTQFQQIEVLQAAQSEFGDEIGRQVGRALGFGDDEVGRILGIPITQNDVAGFAGQIATDPTNLVSVPAVGPAGRAAGQAVRRGVDAVTDAARPVVREGVETARRGVRAVGEAAAERAMEALPSPTVIQRGGGDGGGRAVQRTVEVVREELANVERIVADARARGDDDLATRAREVAVRLESELADAINARRRLEPAIASDVGRRTDELPITEESADAMMSARFPQERVRGAPSDLSGPVGVPPNLAGRQNVGVPFDPASAAAGAGAGAMSEDEEGEQGDPLRTAAGMAIGALGGTPQGRRLARAMARKAQNATPPNLIELVQTYRHSVGLLGNVGNTATLNAIGGPLSIALGLPTEAIKTGVMKGYPVPVLYQGASLIAGLKEASRDLLATAIGRIPQSLRDAPDFRPPISERMTGVGKGVAFALETPGRIATQAPDAFFTSLFTRWGRSRAAAEIMAESGVSRLDPMAQIDEMNRLLTNPTADEAQRITESARAFSDEMTYKGAPGWWEKKIGSPFRPDASRTMTSADPMAKQIHDVIGSHLMPFYSSLFKMQKLMASYVPVTGHMTNRNLARNERIARQLVGLSAGVWMMDQASKGLITGPGPSDPDERAALQAKGWQANSVMVPGIGYVEAKNFPQAATALRAIGGWYDAERYATPSQKADRLKLLDAQMHGAIKSLEDFPVIQAVQSLIAMAESPVKGGADLLTTIGSGYVPALVRANEASKDPYQRTVDPNAPLETQIKQRTVNRFGSVPGLGSRQDSPPALNRRGEPLPNPRAGLGAFIPQQPTPQPEDPAQTEMNQSGVHLDKARQSFSFTRAGADAPDGAPGTVSVKLTPEMQQSWLRYRDEALQQALPTVQGNRTYQGGNEGVRKKVWENAVKNAEAYADRALKAELGRQKLEEMIRSAPAAETVRKAS